MNISLTPELVKFVKSQVESGMYASDSEVLRHGLRLLLEREQERQQKLSALKDAIREGLESPLKKWDPKAFLERMENG